MSDGTETTPGRLDEIYHRPQERKKFRWDPTINAGHVGSAIFTTLTTIIVVMSAYGNLDKRATLREQAEVNQAVRDALQDAAMKEKFGEVKDSLKEVKDSVNELRRDLRKTP